MWFIDNTIIDCHGKRVYLFTHVIPLMLRTLENPVKNSYKRLNCVLVNTTLLLTAASRLPVSLELQFYFIFSCQFCEQHASEGHRTDRGRAVWDYFHPQTTVFLHFFVFCLWFKYFNMKERDLASFIYLFWGFVNLMKINRLRGWDVLLSSNSNVSLLSNIRRSEGWRKEGERSESLVCLV